MGLLLHKSHCVLATAMTSACSSESPDDDTANTPPSAELREPRVRGTLKLQRRGRFLTCGERRPTVPIL